MNRRDAIKSMGLLAGAVVVAPSVLAGPVHDPDCFFAVGDLVYNPDTAETWRVRSVDPKGNPSFNFNWAEAAP